jgi:hypothetical protein
LYCESLIPSYQKGTARRRAIRSKRILCHGRYKNSGYETTTQNIYVQIHNLNIPVRKRARIKEDIACKCN